MGRNTNFVQIHTVICQPNQFSSPLYRLDNLFTMARELIAPLLPMVGISTKDAALMPMIHGTFILNQELSNPCGKVRVNIHH